MTRTFTAPSFLAVLALSLLSPKLGVAQHTTGPMEFRAHITDEGDEPSQPRRGANSRRSLRAPLRDPWSVGVHAGSWSPSWRRC